LCSINPVHAAFHRTYCEWVRWFKSDPTLRLKAYVLTLVSSKASPTPTEKALSASHSNEVGHDKVENFSRTKFAPMILKPITRVVILVISIFWLIPAVYYVFEFEPTWKEEQFLADSHPLQKAITTVIEQFGASSEDVTIDIYYVWGVNDLERNGTSSDTELFFVFGIPKLG